MIKEKNKNLVTRSPVAVVLGHVDHGKCVAPSTLIPLADGRILSAQKIWEEYRTLGKIREYRDEGYFAKIQSGPKIFSLDRGKIQQKKISCLWKLQAPDQMVRVKLASGDEIEVTPEHPFFIFTPGGKIEQKHAGSLVKDDFIIVPQKLNSFVRNKEIKERVIRKFEKLNDFIIFLKNKKKSNGLFKKLRQVNKQKLYRGGLFSTNPTTIIFQKRRFRARDFVKIGKHFGFSFEELYDMIDVLKYSSEKQRVTHRGSKIKLPRFPKDYKKLGYILGCLAGDGQTKHGIFHNSNRVVQKSFQKYMEEVFDVSTKLIRKKTGYKIINRGWETMTKFLTEIADFPRFKKSSKIKFPQHFSTPVLIQSFIAGWFDTDGYVSPINYSIDFTSKSKDLVKEISISLLYFGVHSTIYKTRKKGPGFKRKKTYYCLRIANTPYLERFLNSFPIKHKGKKERIKKAIEKSSTSRIFDSTPISGKNLQSFYINDRLFSYFSKYRSYKFLSRYFLKKLLGWKEKITLPKVFLQPAVKNLINPGEISCIKVKEKQIIKNKYKFVYDFTILNSHNFVAERIFIHNTAILDFIRKTKVVEKESGGITQHIGAYEIEHPSINSGQAGKKITFIDTPGHEAFSAMRSRGARVADIAILVVAGEEGVKPQTKEAISHIKKAQIPMIVAINKIDKPEANPEKVKGELKKEGILVESMGGKIPSVNVSAKTGSGIPELLELILLVAEMEELKTDISKPAEGVVIESYLDANRGPTATLILQDGILKKGDVLGTSSAAGKIKIMEDFQGKPIEKALPSMPVVILGFENVPGVGEKFRVFNNLEEPKKEIKAPAKSTPQVIDIEPDKKVLNLILKVDVLGSLEAIEEVLKELPQEKVILRILKAGLGNINESDLKLARGSRAKIVGFRVKIDPIAKNLGQREKITIITFEVIYELVQAVRQLLEKKVEPEVVRTDLGKVKILAVFRTEKSRQIIGGKVIEGKAKKGASLEVFRNEDRVGKGKIIELQRDKKEVDETAKGSECGILYEGDTKIEEGDILAIYTEERRKGEL